MKHLLIILSHLKPAMVPCHATELRFRGQFQEVLVASYIGSPTRITNTSKEEYRAILVGSQLLFDYLGLSHFFAWSPVLPKNTDDQSGPHQPPSHIHMRAHALVLLCGKSRNTDVFDSHLLQFVSLFSSQPPELYSIDKCCSIHKSLFANTYSCPRAVESSVSCIETLLCKSLAP